MPKAQFNKMQLCLFDTDVPRQKLWSAGCHEHSLEISVFDQLYSEVLRPSSRPRIMVLDDSVVGTEPNSAENIAKVLRQDVLVFSLLKPTCLRIMQLMACGATWALDNAIQQQGISAELKTLVHLTNNHEVKLRQFKKLNQIFSTILTVENEVLLLLLQGMQNNQIAENLDVSVRTVESRRAKILQKVKVESIVDLVRCFDQYQALKKSFY